MAVQGIIPDAVVDALLAAGWEVVGERAGVYKRLAVVDGHLRRLTLVVPLDPSAPEFEELVDAVLKTLETLLFDGKSAHQVLNAIRPGVYQ